MTKYFTFQVRLHPQKHAELIAWLENTTADNYSGIPHVIRGLIADAMKRHQSEVQERGDAASTGE